MSSTAPPSSAWREPLVWMIVGIPALTIVAGVVTLWIALQRADSNVAADYYKRGLTVNLSIERDARAAALGLSAELAFGADDVSLTLDGRLPARPTTVILTLTHPVRAELDLRLRLDAVGDGRWRAAAPAMSGERWQVALEAQDWRLSAQRVSLHPGAQVRLMPPN